MIIGNEVILSDNLVKQIKDDIYTNGSLMLWRDGPRIDDEFYKYKIAGFRRSDGTWVTNESRLSPICYVTDFGMVYLSDADVPVTDGIKFTKRGDIDKRQKYASEKNDRLTALENKLGVSRTQLAQIRR